MTSESPKYNKVFDEESGTKNNTEKESSKPSSPEPSHIMTGD